MLLDLGLPKRDGFEVLRRLRDKDDRLPVIIVTARDAVEDRIRGLDLGADNYVLKPFDVKELLARLRAVIRRQGGQAAPLLDNGVVGLDPATREAQRGDRTHVLSAREFALLHALLLRPGNRLLARVAVLVSEQQRFIADAAHELRTPLTALSLQAQNLDQARSLPAMRERLAPLRAGIERARRLTEQLFSWTLTFELHRRQLGEREAMVP